MASLARRQGKDAIAIADQGGWAHHSRVMLCYMQRGNGWTDNAAAGLTRRKPARPRTTDPTPAASSQRPKWSKRRRGSRSCAPGSPRGSELAEEAAEDGWWDLTDAGARRFGVQTDSGRVLAPVLTGRGHWADHQVAIHIVRNQPLRSLADLAAKALFLDLCEQQDSPLPAGFVAVLRKYASPFPDHPDQQTSSMPENSEEQ